MFSFYQMPQNFKQKSYPAHLEYSKKLQIWRFLKFFRDLMTFQFNKERKGSDAIENQSRLLKKFSFQVFEKEKRTKFKFKSCVTVLPRWRPATAKSIAFVGTILRQIYLPHLTN